jgi:hypothetical protein
MIAFDVYLNGERLCVAGVGDSGVLTACATWVSHSLEMNLDVGGVRRDERGSPAHVRWTDTPIRVGDEIRIRVTDAAEISAAPVEQVAETGMDIEQKKSYARRLAHELGWEIRDPHL